MVLITCIFLVALDKADTVIEYYKRSSIKNRLVIYAMVMLILQIIQLLLIGAIYFK